MKTGRSIEELGQELVRQRKARKDIVTDTRNLAMHTGNNGSQIQLFRKNGKKNTIETFDVSRLAHQQIASRLNIPFRYYMKMMEEMPSLLDTNVNTWLMRTPEKRMLRTLDGNLRAFLSDRYRRLDNLEFCQSILPIINQMAGAEIKSCEVTPDHMYLKVINHTLRSEVTPGDIVEAGFVVSNSEVGFGSVSVAPLIYRLVCTNGLIVPDYGKKKYHAGRQIASGNEAYELYSDATLEADDKAFFMKVGDIVKTAVDETKFSLIVDKMKESANIPLEKDPAEEIKDLGDRFAINEDEQKEILREFFIAGNNTKYGLINAVTAASRNLDEYERATALEAIGGSMLLGVRNTKSALDPKKSEERIPWAPLEKLVK